MAITHQSWPEDLRARLEDGAETGDPVIDAACSALLATGMTPGSIMSTLAQLGRVLPLARTA